MGGSQPPDQGPGPGGPPVSPAPAQQDQSAMALDIIRTIVQGARRMGMKYPAVAQEVRDITSAVQRMQAKIIQSQPAPESQAPPV